MKCGEELASLQTPVTVWNSAHARINMQHYARIGVSYVTACKVGDISLSLRFTPSCSVGAGAAAVIGGRARGSLTHNNKTSRASWSFEPDPQCTAGGCDCTAGGGHDSAGHRQTSIPSHHSCIPAREHLQWFLLQKHSSWVTGQTV